MEACDRLFAIEEIRQVKARYFRFLDTKRWGDLGSLFAVDAVFDARQAMSNVTSDAEAAQRLSESWYCEGRDAIVAFIRSRTGPASTVHHGHMSEVAIIDGKTATSITAMEDQNRYFDSDGRMNSRLHGWGHYHEDFSLNDGIWQIQRSTLTRLRVDLEIFPK